MLKLNKQFINKIFTIKNNKNTAEVRKKNFIKTTINSYDLKMFKYSSIAGEADRFRNKVGRIWHPVLNAVISTSFISNLLGSRYGMAGFDFALIFIQSGLDKMFHNIAMRKASVIVRRLKNWGITDDSDLKFAVNYYLKKNGGLVYSNLVRKFAPNQIKKVTEGEKPPQIKGLITWLQSKISLASFYNEPQMCKAKKNLQKLFKNIINLISQGKSSKSSDV